MMTCIECKERLFPVDPGRKQYGFEPLCQHCPNYEPPPESKGIMQETVWDRHQWDYVKQVEATVKHLENKLNEHIDKAKKSSDKRSKGKY